MGKEIMKKHSREELDSAVDAAVSIDPLDLQDEFRRIPADLARFNELYARALRRFLKSKARTEQVFSLVYLETREGGAKATEAQIKAEVAMDDRYNSALEERIEAEVEKTRLGGILDALMAKKDSLISMGANLRAEMAGNPSIRDRQKGYRDVQDSKGE
jgi:hypothetical protein